MPISSWSNWPPRSPRRPRSPSSQLTSPASSSFPSRLSSFSLENSVSNKEAIDGADESSALQFFVPKVRFAWWRLHKPQEEGLEVYLRAQGLEVYLRTLRRFSLRELKVATNNFADKSRLDCFSYRSIYKGILVNGSLVIVKRLAKISPEMESYFQSQIKMIGLAAHKNLLHPCGFCMTSTERLLVYPYMANGSLASQLRGRPSFKPPLDWPTRRRVALGTARGLSRMHNNGGIKILHLDVKPANIFINEEFEAHLGGFGLTKLMDGNDTHITAAVCGTIGHIAPEFLSTGNCSEKTDVFAYGITLLELVTGKRAFDLARLANSDDLMLRDWVNGLLEDNRVEALVDPELNGNYIEADVEFVVRLAILCSQDSPISRPIMSEVVRMLEAEDLSEITERWKEFKKPTYRRSWRSDSTDNLASIELSSPR